MASQQTVINTAVWKIKVHCSRTGHNGSKSLWLCLVPLITRRSKKWKTKKKRWMKKSETQECTCLVSITRLAIWIYIIRVETLAVAATCEDAWWEHEKHQRVTRCSPTMLSVQQLGGGGAWCWHGSPWERRMGKGHTLSTWSRADKWGHTEVGKQCCYCTQLGYSSWQVTGAEGCAMER